jgi:hypothetical protein
VKPGSVPLLGKIRHGVSPCGRSFANSRFETKGETASRRTRSVGFTAVALLLACTAVFAGSRGDASAAADELQRPQRVREIMELRTISSKTYELADGARQWVGYGEAVHYTDGNGSLQDIDNSIVTEAKQIGVTDYVYRNAANAYTARFAAMADRAKLVDIEFRGTSIAFGPVAAESSGAAKTTDFASKALSEMAYAEDCVAYRDIYPGIDLLYQAKTYGVEEYMVLKEPKTQNEFTFDLTLSGLKVQQADSRISFVDSKGETLFWLSEPLAVDDAGAMTKDVTYSLSDSGANYQLKVTLSQAYLDDAKRSYPVVLDPMIMITGNADTYDTYISSYNPGTNYAYNTYLRTGKDTPYGIRRTYLRFDLSEAIGIDPDNVADAVIRIEKYSGVTPQIRAYRSLDQWSSGTITWNNAPLWPSRYDQSVPSTVATNDGGNWWAMHCTTAVKNWLDGAANPFGWAIKDSRETDTSIWTTFYACDAPSPHKPELQIVYSYEDSTKYMASLYYPNNELCFPVRESWGAYFHRSVDWNGDGSITAEDALESIVHQKIGTVVTGTSAKGNTIASSYSNNQQPAVYFRFIPNPGAGYLGWKLYEYWLYYANNYDTTYDSYHEHDWERYYVWEDDDGNPQYVAASVHQFVIGYDWDDFYTLGLVEGGSHLLLSCSADGHGIWAPSGGTATGVKIRYDGYVSKRSGTLSQGDGTNPGWTHFSNDSLVSPRTSFDELPSVYDYDDQWTYNGHSYGNNDFTDPNDAPWERRTWSIPYGPGVTFWSTD